MRLALYALCGLGAAMPCAVRAQVAPPPAAPHLYVGLAAYASNYLPLGQFWRHGFPVPLQATVGYQLSPRWAVQASGAYSGRSNSYAGFEGSSTTPASYVGSYRERLFTTSVLGRYTLTRQPTHRLQVDVLAGLAWAHLHYTSSYSRIDSLGAITSSGGDYTTNRLLLNAGLGARYRITPRLEATYNVLLNVPLSGYHAGGPQPSMALGLQYHLGRR